MAIPVQQFPILSPQQANPFFNGLSSGMDLYKQFLINKNLPEQLQQQSQARELANQISQTNLKYLAPQLQGSIEGQLLSNRGQSITNNINQLKFEDLPRNLQIDYLTKKLANQGQLLSNRGQSITNNINQLKFEDLPRNLQIDYLTKKLANQGQSLSNQQRQITNQTLPEMNQADLEGKKLGNQQQSIINQTLPEKIKNEILNTYLKNKRETIEQENLPEELKQEALQRDITNGILNVQRKYAEPNAQANLENTQLQNKFLPLDNLIKAQQVTNSNSRFGSAYQTYKALQGMSPPARHIWIAQHEDEYNQMLSDMNAKDNPNLITPDILQQYFPQIGNSSSQSKQPSSINNGGFRQSTPEEVAQTRLANEMAANKGLTTAQTQRQLEGAIQVENIFNDPEFQSQAQNAAAYAGAMGKGKAAIDALSQNNPKAYEDYLSFKNQTLVLLENRIKTLDQMGATNAQRQELKGLYDKTADALTSNPKQFLIQLNNLGRVLNTVAQSVQKSASPLTPQNRIGNFNEIPENQVNTKTINGKTYHRIGNSNEWTY